MHQRVYAIGTESKTLDLKFLYYWIGQNKDYLARVAVGSTVRSLRLNHLTGFPLGLPNYEEQHRIAHILSSLDSKIELNQQTNKTLESLAQALFKHWFVDFEFPDESGRPYRSSGGKMVDSELGMVPAEWKVGVLKDVIENFDSKRVPLSSRERDSRKGTYPYYGAASVVDYVDDYIFDGIYLLMGEDGTVIDDNGYPILQYVWGKFWVNNHAHILRGKGDFSTEYIFLLLKQTNIKHIVTGAVQPKINQENMNGLPVVIPPQDVLSSFQSVMEALFETYRTKNSEINVLVKIRDSILPKLMSGEIRTGV